MKVFICWSGTRSRHLGEALREWLPQVILGTPPFFSPHDIESGARWLTKVQESLVEADAGIICLTRQNRSSPWLYFESGALANSERRPAILPYVLDPIEEGLSGGPLGRGHCDRQPEGRRRERAHRSSESPGPHRPGRA